MSLSGILVDRKTKRKVLGFKNIKDYSIEEIIKNNGLDSNKVDFIREKDLKMNVLDIQDWHLINSDGSVKDIRKPQFEYFLIKKKKIADEEKTINFRRLVFKRKLTRKEEEELEKETGLKIDKREKWLKGDTEPLEVF